MTRFSRGLVAATLPLVLAFTITACGDDDKGSKKSDGTAGAPGSPAPGAGGGPGGSAPTDADTTKFCQTFLSPPPALATDDFDAAADASHEWAATMAKVGTPAELPAPARAGWERLVDFLADVDADDVASYQSESASDPEKVFGKQDADAIRTFLQELDTVCAGVEPPTQ